MDENQSLLPPIFNPKDYEIKLEANNDSKDKIEEELLPNLKNHKSNKNDHRRHQNQEDFVSSILDQDNDNVIDFFENVDPMLAWALLKSKILPQVGMFDLLAERSKLKNANEPVGVVKSLLDELDSLVTEVITMLQNCCETYDHHSGSQDHNQLLNSIQLNPSLSLRKLKSETKRCLKITEKVSFDIASEASYVYIFSSNSVTRQKMVENAKMRHFE